MDNTSSDHNREEASKANKIALEKMKNNEFRHAQQIILEAQKLCSELAENMSQMLIICNIYCAAASIVGGMKDFYRILQVEETVDQTMITKQYRKIALSIHPDKNSFPGAQEAFKLVAEAYSVLSDPAKRTAHDKKRKNGSQNVPKEAKNKKPSNRTGANKGSMSRNGPNCLIRCPHCRKALYSRVFCLTCNKIFKADRKEEPKEPMPSSSSVSNDYQVPESMSKEKQHDTPSQQDHPVKQSYASKGHWSAGGVKKQVDRKISQNNSDAIDSIVEEMCYPVIKIRDINRITYNDGGVDQIWALYDNIDHMPRSYAKLQCVGHSKCLYWLKFYPLSVEEKEWNNKSLPVACGKFCLGEKVDMLEYSSLYSHTVEGKQIHVKRVSGQKGSPKNKLMVYEIYPKRGEAWALYKGWSRQWSSHEDVNKPYEYEVVEVLSDMPNIGGTMVTPLIRIKGFPSLLVAAKDKSPFHIPSSMVFRFSHQIPHYRVSGHESNLKKIKGPILEKRPIVPEGFLLLDSNCLPSDLDTTFPSMNLNSYMSQSKKTSSKQDQCDIVPRVGDIWAIYMDWAPERSSSSNDCCEFAVGEIIERNDTSTKICFLAKVDGCTPVFKADKQKEVLEIPTGKNFRFLHHIPSSFRVTKGGGKLGGFYDLDPAYLPDVFL